MSSSISIPPRMGYEERKEGNDSSSSSSYDGSPQTPQNKGKGPMLPEAIPTPSAGHNRKTSFLSSSFSKQEHTVVNIGDPDGPPRLITCVRSSQGYEWNPEIFLPSYIETDFESPERRREPVHEIILSDEEIMNMFPS